MREHEISTVNMVVIGEFLWDCVVEEGGHVVETPAGAPYNFARHFRELKGETYLISAVGRDDDAKGMMKAFESADLRGELGYSDLPTGKAVVHAALDGSNCFEIVSPAAWDDISYSETMSLALSRSQAIYFGTLAQRSVISRETIRRLVCEAGDAKKLRVLDVNLRAPYDDPDVIRWSLAHADLVKYSRDEVMRLYEIVMGEPGDDSEALAKALFEKYGVSSVIESMDKLGAREWHSDGELAFVVAPDVDPVSTVGAGDAFLACYMVNRLANMDFWMALQQAVNYASSVVAGDKEA